MKEEKLKKITDEIYFLGERNGKILMKNAILKKINRSFKLWFSKKNSQNLVKEILDTIDKIK